MAFSLTRHESLLGIHGGNPVINASTEPRRTNNGDRPNQVSFSGDYSDQNNLRDAEEETFTSVEITHDSGYPGTVELSTSAVLHYCKRRVLLHYFRLLAFLGWRPLFDTSSDGSLFNKFLNIAYTIAVLIFIFVGYLLQYAACFRRDGFNCYEHEMLPIDKAITIPPYLVEKDDSSHHQEDVTVQISDQVQCDGNVIFLYVIPNLLHFATYIYTFCIIRNSENEQLQTILEKVFLQSSLSHAWHLSQRRLMKRLQTFLILGLCWLLVSTAVQVLHVVSEQALNFTWINSSNDTLKIILISVLMIGIFWFDVICIAVVLIYCVHCQLVQSYITNLCDRVRECTLGFQEFIKAIEDSRKILKYVNDVLATGMSLLLIIFACNSSTGLFNIFEGNISNETNIFKIMSSVGSLLLWLSILSFPIIQAIRLTSSLNKIRKLAQEVRSRSFGYTSTPIYELDSFLLYASSLSLKARIFRVPVTYAFILPFITGFFYLMLFLGQVDMLRFS